MNTSSPDASAIAKLNSMIKGIRIAMLTTQASDGSLRSRPMATQDELFDGDLWFFTNDHTGKTEEIAREEHVALTYAEPKEDRYVSISGRACVVRDREQARRLWKPMLKAWFPGGLDDPSLALLRVNVDVAEYWDSGSSKMVSLFKMAKAALGGSPPKDLGEHEKLEVRGATAK